MAYFPIRIYIAFCNAAKPPNWHKNPSLDLRGKIWKLLRLISHFVLYCPKMDCGDITHKRRLFQYEQHPASHIQLKARIFNKSLQKNMNFHSLLSVIHFLNESKRSIVPLRLKTYVLTIPLCHLRKTHYEGTLNILQCGIEMLVSGREPSKPS